MKDSKIITLYKQKGDKGDCNNYRGILLLSVLGKVFARVILPRLQILADRIYPESQCGFRSGRSTTDMIFSVRQIQEKCREQNRPLHIAFVDLTKAFDMVSREGLFAILQRLGCPPKLLSLQKSLHENMSATVCFEGSTSEKFPICCGVKQGCVLAPTLFGIFFSTLLHHAFSSFSDNDSVYLHTRSDGKLFNLSRLRAKSKVRRIMVRELLFADDAALISHTSSGLDRLMSRLNASCTEFALIISIKKTVVMHQSDVIDTPVSINGHVLDTIDAFSYLGSTISRNLSIDKEIDTRIGKAATVFNRLRTRAWQNKFLTNRTKARIYDCCVVSALLYGAETWTTYARHERKLNSFHMRCLRNILGIRWQDRITNASVLNQTNSSSMFNKLKTRRLRWLGHIRRMPDSRLPKDILYGAITDGTRRRGRPLLRFKDVAKRDLKGMGIPTENWEICADDRLKWRKLILSGGISCDNNWLAGLALKRDRSHT